MHTTLRSLGRCVSMSPPLGISHGPSICSTLAPTRTLHTTAQSISRSWRRASPDRSALSLVRQSSTAPGRTPASVTTCTREPSSPLSRQPLTAQRVAEPLQRMMFSCPGHGWLQMQQHGFRTSTAAHAAAKKSAKDLVKRITRDDLVISFARSGGAGGQNVNKVSTKADVRFNVNMAGWLPADMKDALRESEANRFNKEGEIVVTSSRTRSQLDNLEDAIEKLQSFVDAAALAVQPIEEDPDKKKKLAKQLKKANEKRLEQKKMQSQKKGDRRGKFDY